MTVRLAIIGAILTAALAAGTWRDRRPAIPHVVLSGYEVLAVDFHVHTHPLSSATLAPWDVVTEAPRARLDANAVTPHDHVLPAKVARWFSSLVDGPIVLVGEEISASQCHLLAVGIDHTIEWGRRASRTIGDIRRQGGIAIAAHPLPGRWPGCDEAAARLDGSEVVHPIMFGREENAAALRTFNARGRWRRLAAATSTSGSSGWRGPTCCARTLGRGDRRGGAGPAHGRLRWPPRLRRPGPRAARRRGWTAAANGRGRRAAPARDS
jgi:hypothetical protein